MVKDCLSWWSLRLTKNPPTVGSIPTARPIQEGSETISKESRDECPEAVPTRKGDDIVRHFKELKINRMNADFDGDALYLMSVKEMASVVDFLKIHPMSTLLGGEGDGLSATIKMPDEMCISMHNYLSNGDTVDFEKYYQAINNAA